MDLLDPETHPAEEVADLSLRRWEIEVKLRDLKTILRMEILRVFLAKRFAGFFGMAGKSLFQAIRGVGVFPPCGNSYLSRWFWVGPGGALGAGI